MELIYKNAKINYNKTGEGPALVLLHGYVESLAIWEEFVPVLSKEFTVVTIDLPGHGKSECYSDVHTMEEMAEVVNLVAFVCCIDKYVVIGHSMGGYVALALAELYPDSILGLGLFHSSALADTPEAANNRLRTIDIIKQNRIGFIANFIPELFAPHLRESLADKIEKNKRIAETITPQGLTACMEGMRVRKSRIHVLVDAKYPVMFIFGKHDSRLPYERALAQAVLPKHSQILLLTDAGHMGYIEAKKETLVFVKNFASSCIE